MPQHTFEEWFKANFGALGVDPNSLPPAIRQMFDAVTRTSELTRGVENAGRAGIGRGLLGAGRAAGAARQGLTLNPANAQRSLDAWRGIGSGALNAAQQFANPNSPFSQGLANSPLGQAAAQFSDTIGQAARVIPEQLATTYLDRPIAQQGVERALVGPNFKPSPYTGRGRPMRSPAKPTSKAPTKRSATVKKTARPRRYSRTRRV